jgi:hypothetical protein
MKTKRLLPTLGLWAATATMATGLLIGGLPRSADALTMTFGNTILGREDSYTEHGMKVESIFLADDHDHIHIIDRNADGNPDLWNHDGCCGEMYGFTFGGAPFDLVSFDVVKISDGAIGTFTSSSSATLSVTKSGSPHAPFTLSLPGADWSGITSFLWDQSIGNMAIDNLVFNASRQSTSPTPEPSTLALLGTDLVSLLAYGWRRRVQVS